MPVEPTPQEPSRPTDAARLELSQLAPDLPLVDVFARACELASEALGVERVGIWFFVEENTALRCANLYEHTRREHSSGAILRVADFPSYFASLTLRKSVPAEVADSDPRTAQLTAAYLEPLGISSMLDAGIFLRGELTGVVCHEHVGRPCEWTTEARDFAGSMADLIANRMQAAEVSELREALQTHEERLAALDKAEALSLLAGGVAHDFRNLLTVISGYADVLAIRTDVPDEVHKQARAILDASERGNSIVRELLDFARPTPTRPSVISLADALDDILPVVQSAIGHRHRVRATHPTAAGPVLIDKAAFTRAVLNLSINARDAMPAGGNIGVCVAPVRLSGAAAGPYVMLEVVDTGMGMDAATRRRACEAFFTTKAEGTGLGLAIVQRIADHAGGFLRIDSEPGRGTAIRVFFPRIGASSGGTAEMAISPELCGK